MKSIDIYSAIYKVTDENMRKSGSTLAFSEKEAAFFYENNPAVADLDELRKFEDNETFAEMAYISLLKRRIDNNLRLVWSNRLWLPASVFQDCVINQIIYSKEFTEKNVQLKGKMPFLKKGFFDFLFAAKSKLDLFKKTFSNPAERLYTKILTPKTQRAFSVKTVRNKLITCDLFIEKDTAPQDGFELFKYVYSRKNKDIVPYYVMNTQSELYSRFKAEYGDHIIGYNSKKRFSSAEKLISLFKTTKFICDGYKVFNALNIGVNSAIMSCEDAYLIFIQHGVNFFKDNFITLNSYSAFTFDKLMISNEIEKDIFITRGGFTEDAFIENGLFRWDLLSSEKSEKTNRCVFIYFTHRRYLKSLVNVGDSVYVKTIVNLLTHPKFTELIEKNGYTVKIGVHHSVVDACGRDIFKGFQIIDDIDIAEAKATSDILITDYSSMCFEMWFQHKPVIFMNIPDGEDCVRYGHRTDLPAPYRNKEDYLFNLVNSADDCVALLDRYVHNNFSFNEEEKAKRDAFFYYNSGFCERFYNYLLTIKDEKKKLYHIDFNQAYLFSRFAGLYTEGIDTPRSTGRWIIRKKAAVGFCVPKSDKEIAVKLTVQPLLKLNQYQLDTDIFVNGHLANNSIFNERKKMDIFLVIPQEWIASDGYIEISFRIKGCRRYKKIADAPGDNRFVSIHLISLMVFEKDNFYMTGKQYMNIVKANEEKKLLKLAENDDSDDMMMIKN